MKPANIAILALILLSAGGCNSSTESDYSFRNNGFEYGDLTGWSKEGLAFDDVSVQVSDSSGRKNRVAGLFYLDSGVHGYNQTGRIDSETFTLKGNGKIGILLGGVRDQSKCYVALMDDETGEQLAKTTNTHFNIDVPTRAMYRHTLDAKAFLGRDVYISIIDNDDSELNGSYLLVDDIDIDFKGRDDAGTLIQDARDYTEKYKSEVGDAYRHKYHLMPEIGWMNDPNGLVFHDGKYHLFYQHNPYSVNWDTMHWGHAVSEDLIKWEDAEIALVPDSIYDKLGVFSGGAITDKNGNLNLLYTAVGEGGVQQQALATSFDGLNFSKRSTNPIIDSSMRLGSRVTDFRDPFLYQVGSTYYAIIGGKLEGAGGQLLLYKSNDLFNWQSVGVTYSSSLTGTGMFECPNVIGIDGKDIIVTSPQSIRDEDMAGYQNIHSVTYQIGEIDYNYGLFLNDFGQDSMTEFDKGFDFYATQTIKNDDQNLLLAWMNMWSRSYPSAIDGWTGAVTLPRDMKLIDGHIYQEPIAAIENYYVNEATAPDITLEDSSMTLDLFGSVLNFKADIDVSDLGAGKAGFEVFKGANEATRIYYDAALGMVVFDRQNSGTKINSADDDGELNVRYARVDEKDEDIVTLEFFLDVSSVEVFINDGYYTMSGLVYPNADSNQIAFFAEDGSATMKNAVKHDIEVQ